MPVPKGYKFPPSQSARHRIPSGKQVRVLRLLEQSPGLSIADLCRILDGRIKKDGSAMYVTVRRMIKRGFLRTSLGKRNAYKLYAAWKL